MVTDVQAQGQLHHLIGTVSGWGGSDGPAGSENNLKQTKMFQGTCTDGILMERRQN